MSGLYGFSGQKDRKGGRGMGEGKKEGRVKRVFHSFRFYLFLSLSLVISNRALFF